MHRSRQIGARRRKILRSLIGGTRQLFGVPERLIDHPMFGPHFRQILTVIGNTQFPPGGEIPYSAEDVNATEYICEYFRRIPAREADLLCLALLLYEYGVPKITLKGWRFSQMAPEARTELMESLHDSEIVPLRMLNFTLRMILSYAYMADERVLEEMGFYKRHPYASETRDIVTKVWDREAAEAALQALQQRQADGLAQEDNPERGRKQEAASA